MEQLRPIAVLEPCDYSKTISELQNIFPNVENARITECVQQTKGNLNESLALLLQNQEINTASPRSSIPPTVSPSSIFAFLPTNETSLGSESENLEALKTKYGKQLENVQKAVGDQYSELEILKCFEDKQGDVREVMVELLGKPSINIRRSSQSLNAENLRRSASLISSKSLLKSSSGIEELPVNVNLSLLDEAEETEEPVILPPLMGSFDDHLAILTDETESTASEDSSSSSLPDSSQSTDTQQTSSTDTKAEVKTLNTKRVVKQAVNNAVMDESHKGPVAIVDKQDLKAETHDKDALNEFLGITRKPQAGATGAAAAEARKISKDDRVVMGHNLRVMKQFLAARKEIELKGGASTTKSTKKTKEESKDDLKRVENETTTVIGSAPLSTLQLADFIATLPESDLLTTVEMCLQTQKDELEELKCVLTADTITVSESTPKVVSISLSEPKYMLTSNLSQVSLTTSEEHDATLVTQVTFRNPALLQLIFVVPVLYPEVAPAIAIRSMSGNCPFGLEHLERLETHLKEQAEMNKPFPSMFMLQQAAEAWIADDSQLRRLAVQAHLGASGAALNDNSFFDSLNLIFSFDTDYTFHKFEDIVDQRNKAVKRATLMLVNSPAAASLPPPLVPSAPPEFPVKSLIGDLDVASSLKSIGLSFSAVRVLLHKFDWKLKELSSSYLSSLANGTYRQFLKSNGIIEASASENEESIPSVTEIIECPTCMDAVPAHSNFALGCGHHRCFSCYMEYVDVEIATKQSTCLVCSAPGCKYMLDNVSLAALLTSKRWHQYTTQIVSQYVLRNASLDWCPSKLGCDYIIQTAELEDGFQAMNEAQKPRNADSNPTLIQCPCSHTYCSSCRIAGGHYPATCSEMKRWYELVPDDGLGATADSLSENIIKKITRSCPKCNLSISKSEGCPHMVCAMCSHQFCWACFSDWSSAHYACDQSSIQITTEIKFAQVERQNFRTLITKVRNISLDVSSTLLKDKLLAAMYRQPQVGKKGDTLTKLITINDVDPFIKSLELLQLAYYLTMNTAKAAFVMYGNANAENRKLFAAVNRVIQDIQFLSDFYKMNEYRKELTYHINAATIPLKKGLKVMLDEMQTVRLGYLAWIQQNDPFAS